MVLLQSPTPATELSLIEAVHALEPGIEFLRASEIGDATDLGAIEIVLGWRLPKGLAARLTGLRWICSRAAGVEKLLDPQLDPRVIVSRTVDPEQALGMAQFAALVVLRHARSLPHYEALQRERVWRRQPLAAARQRVAVLGLGEVGREVARQLGSLGFAVEGWRRDGTPLHALLARCEIVVNTLPLTPQTAGLLDAGAFASMPRGAYLVNLARGGHVVEADLIAAVRSGHLAGAALDVQQHEPMAADDPLWSVPGILITPHIASEPSNATIATQFVESLRRWRRGELPLNVVDRERGY